MNDHRLKDFIGSFYITGFMGAGKSAIGSRLAQKLQLPFHDLDKYISHREEASIPDIFEQHGEQYFREKEKEYLLELTNSFKGVLSLGGGALQNQHVVDHLKIHGLLIFIEAPLGEVLDRVLGNPKRPIVRNAEGEIKSRETLKIELETLYSSRIELYEQAEVKIINSGSDSKEIVVDRLIDKIKKHV